MPYTVVQKFQSALNRFVNEHKKNRNVIGILLTGSFVHSSPDKNSDLDVYIILKESVFGERGNTWIDGIEIEYFINPIKQIRHYFKTEVGDKAPSTAHMIANSVILYKNSVEVDRLIKESKNILSKRAPMLRMADKELSKYYLDDLRKDLEDVFLRKDKFAFSIIAVDILNKSLSVFMRWKRLHKEKSKRLHEQLLAADSTFEKIYSRALMEKSVRKQYAALVELVDYLEKGLGGKRAKEWNLKSKCDS
jgi:predicted nucleotidyltransferase